MTKRRKYPKLVTVNGVESKACTKCDVVKPLDDFYRKRKGRGGREPNCKECCRERKKEYRENKMNPKPKVEKPNRLSNEIRIEDDVAIIVMGGSKNAGVEVIVDIEELPKLHEKYTSVIIHESRGGYVSIEGNNRDTKKYESINRTIMNAEGGDNVQSIDGNPFDLRKTNLSFANTDEVKRKASERRQEFEKALPFEDVDTVLLREYFGGCAFRSNSGNIDDSHDDHFIALSIGHGGFIRGNIYPLSSRLNFRKRNKNPFEFYREIKHEMTVDDIRNFWNIVGFLAYESGMTIELFIEYVNWCYANPRSVEQIKADNERYGRNGRPVTSKELFMIAKSKAMTA